MKKPTVIEPGTYDDVTVNPAWNKLSEKLKPMDFFCTQGAGFLGWGIRQITKNMSPDRECEFNHAGLFPDGDLNTLEALWKVESTNFAEHYEGCKVLVGRWKKMDTAKANHAYAKISEHIGQPYPTRRILFHLFNVAHHVHWINAVVCSELVAKALFYAGARDHKWWGVTPDNLADNIEHKLNEERTGPRYKIIFKGQLPWMLYKYCVHCKRIDLVDLLLNRCYKCNNHYLDDLAVNDERLSQKIKEYNYKKLNYISKQ